MNIEWTKKDVPLTEGMKERVEVRAGNIQKRFPNEDFSLTIALIQNKGSKKPYSYRIKAVLTSNDMTTIKAESREMDYYDAVDKAMDLLLRNLIKEREKNEKRNRHLKRVLKEHTHPIESIEEFDEGEFNPYQDDQFGDTA